MQDASIQLSMVNVPDELKTTLRLDTIGTLPLEMFLRAYAPYNDVRPMMSATLIVEVSKAADYMKVGLLPGDKIGKKESPFDDLKVIPMTVEQYHALLTANAKIGFCKLMSPFSRANFKPDLREDIKDVLSPGDTLGKELIQAIIATVSSSEEMYKHTYCLALGLTPKSPFNMLMPLPSKFISTRATDDLVSPTPSLNIYHNPTRQLPENRAIVRTSIKLDGLEVENFHMWPACAVGYPKIDTKMRESGYSDQKFETYSDNEIITRDGETARVIRGSVYFRDQHGNVYMMGRDHMRLTGTKGHLSGPIKLLNPRKYASDLSHVLYDLTESFVQKKGGNPTELRELMEHVFIKLNPINFAMPDCAGPMFDLSAEIIQTYLNGYAAVAEKIFKALDSRKPLPANPTATVVFNTVEFHANLEQFGLEPVHLMVPQASGRAGLPHRVVLRKKEASRFIPGLAEQMNLQEGEPIPQDSDSEEESGGPASAAVLVEEVEAEADAEADADADADEEADGEEEL